MAPTSLQMKKAIELTLAILKPSTLKRPLVVEAINKSLESQGLRIVRSRVETLPREIVDRFYEEHRGRFFYNRLGTYMSSGPIQVSIVAGEDAIAKWRKLLGHTKVARTQFEDPESLRGQFGLSDTRNVGHGSDSPVSAAKEIEFFFPDFDTAAWLRAHSGD